MIWSVLSVVWFLLGWIIHGAGWEMNKQTWSPRYDSCRLTVCMYYLSPCRCARPERMEMAFALHMRPFPLFLHHTPYCDARPATQHIRSKLCVYDGRCHWLLFHLLLRHVGLVRVATTVPSRRRSCVRHQPCDKRPSGAYMFMHVFPLVSSASLALQACCLHY